MVLYSVLRFKYTNQNEILGLNNEAKVQKFTLISVLIAVGLFMLGCLQGKQQSITSY